MTSKGDRDVRPGDGELFQLELVGWGALAIGGDTAAEFYRRILASRVLALLPGGVVVEDRDELVSTMRSAGWDWYELSGAVEIRLADDAAVVAYRAARAAVTSATTPGSRAPCVRVTPGGWPSIP
jgi:hypothetical protein